MQDLDEKDCTILDMLQDNCRTSLTSMAKRIGLSIDSVTKRIKKMEKNALFHSRIQIRPRNLGFTNIVDVKIKLNNHSKKEIEMLIDNLIKNPRVAEVFSIGGLWDLSIVIVSKNAEDLEDVALEILKSFWDLLNNLRGLIWTIKICLMVRLFL